MKYIDAPDIREKVSNIIEKLELDHIRLDRIACVRSSGTSTRNIIARCHALPKVMQHALPAEPFYVIELISERFDKMNEQEQLKTLIHELSHIPKAFGGGFRYHDFVESRRINKLFEKFCRK